MLEKENIEGFKDKQSSQKVFTQDLKKVQYIDFHTHMHDKAFDLDSEEVMQEIIDNNITIVTIGTDIDESQKAKNLSDKYSNVFYTIGTHPHDIPNADFDESLFVKLLGDKCIAVGECGLDYFYLKEDLSSGKISNISQEIDRQKSLFIKQIRFAKKFNKKLMIHGRPSLKNDYDNIDGMDAYRDILQILKQEDFKFGGNVHFFVGNIDIARDFMDLDFTFSFGGVITLTKDFDEIIKYIPIERIHAETDSPYISPKDKNGNRIGKKVLGKWRNDSVNIIEIINQLSELKSKSPDELAIILLKNFEDFIKQ